MYIHLIRASTGLRAVTQIDLKGGRYVLFTTALSEASSSTLVTRATVWLRIQGGRPVHDVGSADRAGDFDMLVSHVTCTPSQAKPLHDQQLRVQHALALDKLPWILDQIQEHYSEVGASVEDACREEPQQQHMLEVAHA